MDPPERAGNCGFMEPRLRARQVMRKPSCRRVHSAVVVPCLEQLDSVGEHLVHQAVGFVDTPRPHVTAEVLQGLRFADAGEGILEHRFHEGKDPHCHLAIGVHPVSEILQALILKDRHPGPRRSRWTQDAPGNPNS